MLLNYQTVPQECGRIEVIVKSKFIPGIIVGMLCSLLILTGVYLGTDFGKTQQKGDVNSGTVSPTPISEQEEGHSSGSLLDGNAAVNTSGTLDFKAQQIQQLIDEYFLYDVSEEDYETAIYRALMNACNDPYSTYYTDEEYKLLQDTNNGTYCGIGCMVSQNRSTMLITVVKVFRGSPAEKAGIKAGDVIYMIDGVDITSQDANLVVSKLKGEEGTDVVITVYREGESDFLDFNLTRAFVQNETIETERIQEDGHKLGMITVTEFEKVTKQQFFDAIEELTAWGAEGLIIDLRDNPGGLLDVVVDMLDPLLPEGVTVYTQDKNGEKEIYSSDANVLELPLAVLINGHSASASEIFAGAIQDYGVGTLIGTQSFGKGIVQTIISFQDGSAIKMTIADYYTPMGRNIHGVGISPDLIVELPEGTSASNVSREQDTQYAAAVHVLLEQLQ